MWAPPWASTASLSQTTRCPRLVRTSRHAQDVRGQLVGRILPPHTPGADPKSDAALGDATDAGASISLHRGPPRDPGESYGRLGRDRRLVPRVNTRAARAVAALAALHRCLSRHTALSASQTAAQPIQRTNPPSLLTERVPHPPGFPFRARGTVHGPPVPDAMCAARSTSQRACARACACAILGCCMVRSSGPTWTGASPSWAS